MKGTMIVMLKTLNDILYKMCPFTFYHKSWVIALSDNIIIIIIIIINK